jgi:T5SS/PEP-CTERM-associated repeat protein
VGTGTLNIENGGTVTNQTFAYIGNSATATGTVNVTGTGSAWNSTGELHVGHTGTGMLNIENGASVSTDGITLLGVDSTATGAVAVTGAGSAWETTGDIAVGNVGTGTLNIENGAAVSNDGVSYLGLYAGSTGTATVTGPGSVWENTGKLYVGYLGVGTLLIENGATVSTGGGSRVGLSAGSTGTATVTGTGSVWNIAEHLDIGTVGTGTLNILNGGVVNNQLDGSIGLFSGSYGTVNVDASTWSIPSDDLVVGYHGTGELNISNGGQINTYVGRIGYTSTGIGTAHVSGGSVWEQQALFVGYDGHGTLLIDDGGRIESAYGTIGHQTGSVGVATVTGVGSTWNSESGMTIGNTGNGTLLIENAATVSLGVRLRLGFAAEGIGVVNLAGGTLDLNDGEIIVGLGDGTFNFTGGTLKNAGSIQLGEPFAQDGGTLAPGSSIGQTDIVGDYDLNAGTLEIELGGLGDPIDMVSVTGDIDITSLGTTLDLIALGPMTAGTYTLLETTAGTITGMFENISPFNLFGVNVTVLNTGNAITVTLDGDLIFADPNLDGFVGIADLNIVLGNWNQSVTAGDISLGDLNGDGFVGIDDLNAVLGHWNAGSPPPPEVLASVPEPTGAGYMLLVAISACRRCRERSA